MDTQSTTGIWRVKRVIQEIGLSRTTIWRGVRNDTFPKPIRLGVNSVGWLKKDVLEWMDSRPRL